MEEWTVRSGRVAQKTGLEKSDQVMKGLWRLIFFLVTARLVAESMMDEQVSIEHCQATLPTASLVYTYRSKQIVSKWCRYYLSLEIQYIEYILVDLSKQDNCTVMLSIYLPVSTVRHDASEFSPLATKLACNLVIRRNYNDWSILLRHLLGNYRSMNSG